MKLGRLQGLTFLCAEGCKVRLQEAGLVVIDDELPDPLQPDYDGIIVHMREAHGVQLDDVGVAIGAEVFGFPPRPRA